MVTMIWKYDEILVHKREEEKEDRVDITGGENYREGGRKFMTT